MTGSTNSIGIFITNRIPYRPLSIKIICLSGKLKSHPNLRSGDVRFEAGQLFEHLRHRWNRRYDAVFFVGNPLSPKALFILLTEAVLRVPYEILKWKRSQVLIYDRNIEGPF